MKKVELPAPIGDLASEVGSKAETAGLAALGLAATVVPPVLERAGSLAKKGGELLEGAGEFAVGSLQKARELRPPKPPEALVAPARRAANVVRGDVVGSIMTSIQKGSRLSRGERVHHL